MSVVVAGRVALVLAVTAGLVAGCARFDDSASNPFTPAPTLVPEGQQPSNTPPPSTSAAPRPSGPCIDPDPAVVVSCLDTTGGITVLPGGQQALVTERVGGRILKITAVDPSEAPPEPVEIARIGVDATGDGGLTDVTLSPSYPEDGLIYAYITTGSDNRVVRIGADGVPKPILTGIPKGATGNRGAIDFVNANRMVVLTGDTGSPAAAADPNSLAGKLLTVDNPTVNEATPKVVASGLGAAGGVCPDHQDSIWFTDRTAAEDRLQRLAPDGTVTTAWTWPDRPGVGGCAAAVDGVAVAMAGAKALAFAAPDPTTHAITAAPTMVAQNKYGALNAASLDQNGFVWVDTVNKQGQPGPFDDRVVRIPPLKGGSGGSPD
ncbi:PQQ-dependent sugar dehydrogenase [Nocardia terpenica]|uniref:PQQ-dependent sugar dehydrogenase n=1 Tax=Nocardia terpenica TaxID=455432 RepID=UPI0018947ACF|nr:PQQ-dependent sugar dehydrogenase [Nocardia terpenica]MBF6063880.1 PQQ-dependent sugar dehydrogenase [Nocardia terpenica]MBF6121061.1 PQQ-dependent sugar dehydrogenase [Nocardia terpenica]MBF6153397.1 PQQ-dependent sugar dehydrogenase [Nocardia terpenica]